MVSVFAAGFYQREDVPEIGLQNAGQYLGEVRRGHGIVGLTAAEQGSEKRLGCRTLGSTWERRHLDSERRVFDAFRIGLSCRTLGSTWES